MKIEQPVTFEGPRMWKINVGKYYPFQKIWKMGSMHLPYVDPKLVKVCHIDFIETVVK